jgi:hypothetical protein
MQGSLGMSELQNRSSDDSATTVQISPPDIVRRRGRALSQTLAGYAELCLSSQTPSEIAAIVGRHIVDLISHCGLRL